ncbi:MAG: response regulator [Kiritimatiellae bacterium]|nr:response regulator [Kiritimatiellia bacterium]
MAIAWVIDDDSATCDVICAMLKELGYEARSFNKAREALANYRPGCADVVITDIRMPGIDGLELTRALKKKRPARRDYCADRISLGRGCGGGD